MMRAAVVPGEADALPRVRAGILVGILVYACAVTADLVRFPGILAAAGGVGLVYLTLVVVTLGVYVALAWRQTRRPPPATAGAVRTGVWWGTAIGGLWMIEIVVGNVPRLPAPVARPLYFGAAACAYVLPAVVSGRVAQRTGSLAGGVWASTWCGLVSGLMTALWLIVVMHLLLVVGISQQDPQNIQEFHRSHASDLTTFVIGDTLLGATNHLWLIGPVLCTLAGVVGGAISRGRQTGR